MKKVFLSVLLIAGMVVGSAQIADANCYVFRTIGGFWWGEYYTSNLHYIGGHPYTGTTPNFASESALLAHVVNTEECCGME